MGKKNWVWVPAAGLIALELSYVPSGFAEAPPKKAYWPQ